MKRVLLWVFYILLGLFLVFVAGGFVLPNKAHVSRSTTITAPPEKIYGIVSDLRRAHEWQPWFKLDPNMSVNIEGEGGTVGQKLSWVSTNPNVGTGSQTITAATANESLVSALDFGDMGKATATVRLVPDTGGTRVSWEFDTALNNVFERWFGLLFDRFIGPDFEKGLAALKTFVEAQP